jgi:peptidoglycan hydrolase-like protein with peptidoglycan-binding domain
MRIPSYRPIAAPATEHLNSHIQLNISAPAANPAMHFPKPGPVAPGVGSGAAGPNAWLTAQKQLSRLGFLAGTNNGAPNQATRSALGAFQHHYGLQHDGVLGQQSQAALHYYAGST